MTSVFGFDIMTLVMKMKNNIGYRIKEFRTRAKLSQIALAKELGVTNRAVSNWESGQNGIDVDLIPAICTILGVSPNELLDTPETNKISAEASAFAKAFDALDAPGKAVLQAVLDTQQQRIKEYGPAAKRAPTGTTRRVPLIQGADESEI